MRKVPGITYRYRLQAIDKSPLLHFATASRINDIFCDVMLIAKARDLDMRINQTAQTAQVVRTARPLLS
jgi:hypothetical protein